MTDSRNAVHRTTCLFGGALFSAGLAVAAAADPIALSDRVVDGTLDNFEAVAIADVNGDGHIDIISGRAGDSSTIDGGVSVHLSNGGDPPSFSTETVENNLFLSVQAIATGDLNGDGHIDIVTANYNDGSGPIVEWFANDGALTPDFGYGIFVPQGNEFDSNGSAVAIAVADMDGDMDLDIVVSAYSSNGDGAIYWVENSGGGTLNIINELYLGMFSPGGLDVCDVNGDTHLDVVVGVSDEFLGNPEVVWFESDGAPNPQFTRRDIAVAGAGRVDVQCADVDADGDTDIFFGRTGSGFDSAGWLESDGGMPPDFTVRALATSGRDTKSIVSGDFDGDGDVDLAGLSTEGVTPVQLLRWWENDGAADPTFTLANLFTFGGPVRSLDAGDLDGDGDSDFAAAVFSPGSTIWFENLTDPLPVITDQPDSLLVTAPDMAAVSVVANAATTYQWQFNGMDITDDGTYSGTDTPTLLVTTSLGAQGLYQCVVGNLAGQVTSDAAVLAVAAAPSVCPGDLNGDGATNLADFNILAGDFGCFTP
ncbi:MAG: VCBS repeat-containing protein [Planctomycetota bacterium]